MTTHAAVVGEPAAGARTRSATPSQTLRPTPDSSDDAISVLRLAMGRPLPAHEGVDWDAVFTIAVAERCAALAWNRSGSTIRTAAPADVVARWRGYAVECDALGHRQLEALSVLIDGLAAAGTAPIVLKGLPLAWRLYGDIAIRGSADIDVFVPLDKRPRAERALLDMAWQSVEGTPPWTQTFSRAVGRERFYLELHSSLLDFNLAHLRPPAPAAHEVVLDGVRLPVHDDDMLPAYLAAHAAKHMPASLLYDVDFHTLWEALAPEQREAASRQAAAVGLTGYLSWMVARIEAVDAATTGDRAALVRLGIEAHGRSAWHAVFRDIALAETPVAAARSVAAWIWPPNLRADPSAFLHRCAHRLRSSWSGYARKRQRYGGPTQWTGA